MNKNITFNHSGHLSVTQSSEKMTEHVEIQIEKKHWKTIYITDKNYRTEVATTAKECLFTHIHQ